MYTHISIDVHIYIYIYISKFGGCKRQDSPAKRNPVQTGNTTTTTRRRRRRRLLLLLLIIKTIILIIMIGDARGRERDKVAANPGNRDRVWLPWRVVVACRGAWGVAHDPWHRAWRAIDGTVRGARSMAPWTKQKQL